MRAYRRHGSPSAAAAEGEKISPPNLWAATFFPLCRRPSYYTRHHKHGPARLDFCIESNSVRWLSPTAAAAAQSPGGMLRSAPGLCPSRDPSAERGWCVLSQYDQLPAPYAAPSLEGTAATVFAYTFHCTLSRVYSSPNLTMKKASPKKAVGE